MTTHTLRARAGRVIGRDHILRAANCQDAFALIERPEVLVGVVCDGCGEGAHSEVGATLGAAFISAQISRLIAEGVPVGDIPALLYPRVVDFLRAVLDSTQPANPVLFVRDHLLFTVIGAILSEQGGLIFAAGDGLIATDGHLIRRDEANQPSYIAYHLLDRAVLGGGEPLADSFEVMAVPSDWNRAAIASDGFEPEVLPQMWHKSHPRGVQRLMNALSEREKRFRDDATLIVFERGPQG
ncbi:hypothetical protein ANRL4_05559 [Anaerolineae bacterium]|nr:hypothetical protein ANRL4_05559 [Anaerolineae bacterium]